MKQTFTITFRMGHTKGEKFTEEFYAKNYNSAVQDCMDKHGKHTYIVRVV
jgi:hypothetical protein